MLPVQAWPPGPPGASLSPFGKPRQVPVGCNGFVIPKGAWIVACGANRVVMFYPPVERFPAQTTLGTGLLPGSIPPRRASPCGCPPATKCGCSPPGPWKFQRHDDVLEAFRAWQRKTGNTDPPLRQFAGHRPPNWFGWKFVPAPSSTLVNSASSGLVIADGQNVVIVGGGCATITQAYSV